MIQDLSGSPNFNRRAVQTLAEEDQALFAASSQALFVWLSVSKVLAKRAETREKRIRESIALLAAGKKLGLK